MFGLDSLINISFVFQTNKNIHSRAQNSQTKVGGGQATLTIPGTNIQIPLGPTQPSQQQQQPSNQNQPTNQNQQNVNQTNNQNQSGTQQVQSQSNNNQNAQQTQNNNQQQQQQNTVITIPGTNNTIQIPANFAGKPL